MSKSFYLYQCGNSEYFALSETKFVKRRLPKTLAQGEWHLRRRVAPRELDRYYREALKLLSTTGFCILNLAARAVCTAHADCAKSFTLPVSQQTAIE